MSFETEHDKWIKHHLKLRTEERYDALKRGHGFGNKLFVETVWWPLAGNFDNLHPEYQVQDWRGRSYFADFLWKKGLVQIIIEIMDFGSHGTDRSKYRQDLNRGLFLQSQDFSLYYISLDEMKQNPSFILSALRSILNPYLTCGVSISRFSKIEKDLMRAAIRRSRVIRPIEAVNELELDPKTITKYCNMLIEKGKFRAIPKGISNRVNAYEYIGPLHSPDLV